MKTKEEYRAAADKRMQPLLDTLRRNLFCEYNKKYSDGTFPYCYCEDCDAFLSEDPAIVKAVKKGEKPACPECGGLVLKHTPTVAN